MVDRIPILKIGNFLLVTIQVDFQDKVALALQEDLSEKIIDLQARGVLIDISALEMVDSFMGRVLGNIAKTSRLLDCQTVLVGMQPAIAITITELGIPLRGIHTALSADDGLKMLNRMINSVKSKTEDQHRRRQLLLR